MRRVELREARARGEEDERLPQPLGEPPRSDVGHVRVGGTACTRQQLAWREEGRGAPHGGRGLLEE